MPYFFIPFFFFRHYNVFYWACFLKQIFFVFSFPPFQLFFNQLFSNRMFHLNVVNPFYSFAEQMAFCNWKNHASVLVLACFLYNFPNKRTHISFLLFIFDKLNHFLKKYVSIGRKLILKLIDSFQPWIFRFFLKIYFAQLIFQIFLFLLGFLHNQVLLMFEIHCTSKLNHYILLLHYLWVWRRLIPFKHKSFWDVVPLIQRLLIINSWQLTLPHIFMLFRLCLVWKINHFIYVKFSLHIILKSC